MLPILNPPPSSLPILIVYYFEIYDLFDIKRSYLNCKIILINCSMLTEMFVQLNKQCFWKCDMAREWKMRHKNSEKSEDQGTNTAPRWRSWNWIQASFIILSALNERICRELNYNSCGLQGQRTKMIINHWVIRKQ